jgi:RND family efflux transporter MFP subunit
MKRHLKLIAVPLLIAAMASPAMAQEGEAPKPKVEVLMAQAMNMAPDIEIPGTVVSRNDARIAAEVAGRVDWVADEGALLKVGDVIARLDNRGLKFDLAEAATNIARLEADYNYQNREAKRFAELAKKGTISKSRFDEKTTRRDVLRQSLAAARIQYERIAYNLERSEVKAPFPGRVVERLVQVGEFTTPGSGVARFVDTVNIEVRARVPVAAAPWLSADQLVEVRYKDNAVSYPVRTVIPVGDELSRTFEIRVRLDDPDWIVGSAVRLSVPNGQVRSVIAAPRDALIIRSTGITVFKINADNKAERLQVKTGTGKADYISVEGPVLAGDRLVVRGGEFLRPGQEVEILGTTS